MRLNPHFAPAHRRTHPRVDRIDQAFRAVQRECVECFWIGLVGGVVLSAAFALFYHVLTR